MSSMIFSVGKDPISFKTWMRSSFTSHMLFGMESMLRQLLLPSQLVRIYSTGAVRH